MKCCVKLYTFRSSLHIDKYDLTEFANHFYKSKFLPYIIEVYLNGKYAYHDHIPTLL